ncbi:MAG: hypothetical protein JWO37_1720 [Acidimicrobiales bacterium]|nr:hypothetical protein [Acidimicrobiales bacterium]
MTRRGRRRAWRITRVVVSVGAVALAAVVIAGRRDEIAGATSAFDHLHVLWVVAAVVSEALAIVSFAAVQRVLLAAGGTPVRMGPLTAITLAGNALQNSLPGGAAVASVYAFRQFRTRGADDVLAGWILVAVSLLSGVTIALIAAVGVALSAGQASANDLIGVVVATLVIAVVSAIAVRRGAVPAIAGWAIRAGKRVTGRPKGDAQDVIDGAVDRLRTVTPTRHDWAIAGGMAMGNWIWDCGALAFAFLAVGSAVPWRGLLLAYGAGMLAANLPITPGGLGVVEGSLTIALVAYGGAQAPTVAAVLLYRIVSFWALLPIGWTAVGGLAWRNRRLTTGAVA